MGIKSWHRSRGPDVAGRYGLLRVDREVKPLVDEEIVSTLLSTDRMDLAQVVQDALIVLIHVTRNACIIHNMHSRDTVKERKVHHENLLRQKMSHCQWISHVKYGKFEDEHAAHYRFGADDLNHSVIFGKVRVKLGVHT